MRFPHILSALYCEPWLITAEMHKRLCQIVDQHITGAAHDPGGIVQAFADSHGNGRDRDLFTRVGNIAQVNIHGVVGKRVGAFEKCSGVMDCDDVERALAAALDDSSIEGILLDVDSPGGTVTGVPELAAVIAEVDAQKPVVAFTDRQMASAAYYLAAGARAIYATGSAHVGSIGVYSAWLDASRAFEMNGLSMEVDKVGKYKAAGLYGTSMTAEQRDLIHSRTEEVAAWFKGFVRGQRPAVPESAMEGQEFYGVEAKANGLVDEVGGLEDAFDELESLIGL